MAHSGSRVPSASSSAAALAPPAPNWMPTSGLAFSPAFCTFSTSRSQSSVGMVMKPLEISMMSKPSAVHSLDVPVHRVRPLGQHVLDEAAGGDQHVVLVARSMSSLTAWRGIRVKEPPANFSEST